MSKTLYVGNLPYTTTVEKLKDLFSGYNIEDIKVIMDRDSGRSRGFGFVDFSYDGEAEKAIKALNGHSLEDRTIVVNEARPRTNRNSRGSDRSFNRPTFNKW